MYRHTFVYILVGPFSSTYQCTWLCKSSKGQVMDVLCTKYVFIDWYFLFFIFFSFYIFCFCFLSRTIFLESWEGFIFFYIPWICFLNESFYRVYTLLTLTLTFIRILLTWLCVFRYLLLYLMDCMFYLKYIYTYVCWYM